MARATPIGVALLCVAGAAGALSPSVKATPSRRDALRLITAIPAAAAFGTTPPSALAYDAIPSAAAPDPAVLAAERAQRRRVLQERATRKNSEVASLVAQVSDSTTSAEFVNAMDTLSVWIVGQGTPRTCVGACQWLTAEDTSPLPEGFKTRELVAAVKAAKGALPQVAYACEMTRTNKGVCFSAGPQAEGAYQALLTELKSRAPLRTCTRIPTSLHNHSDR
jgi:hypothetical protein